MKKIIYTGAFRFPNGDAASQRVLNNAKIFRGLGYEVEFLSWGGKPREEDKAKDGFYYYQGFRYTNTNDIDNKDNLNFIQWIDSVLRRGKNSYQQIKKQIEEISIVVAYNSTSYFTSRLFSICKKNNKQLIADITEWYSAEETPGGKLGPFYWLGEYNMKFVQKKVLNKIVISRYLDTYYSKSKNLVLPPLVDCTDDKWNLEKDVLPKTNNLRIFYAGTPGMKDQLQVVINAVLDCLKQRILIDFVILGVSLDDIKHYSCYSEVLQYKDNIQLLGRVPQLEVPLYYKASDFSILLREDTRKSKAGFPTKLAESLMSGCPVIVNYTSDISTYIKDGENGIVIDGYTETAVKNALHKAVSIDKSKIMELKSNALQSAHQYFDYKNYKNALKDFLSK